MFWRLGVSRIGKLSTKSLHRYNPSSQEWHPYSATRPSENKRRNLIQTFALITWNVDFSRDFKEQRLITALDYIQSIVELNKKLPFPLHTLVLIQELHRNCFKTLLEHPFVRNHCDVTDCNADEWSIHYGAVTLVPRSDEVKVNKVFSATFEDSRMGREALFVDMEVGGDGSEPRIVRIANTHLESLSGFGDIARPKQLAVVASHLSEHDIHAGIVAGDMNPIGPKDGDLPESLGLSDAWKECHSSATAETEEVKRREEEGYTWGYQPRGRFPPKRMDKVLFKGPLIIKEIERIAVGLKVSPEEVEGRTNVWASDHYGLHAKIEVSSS